MSLFIRAPMHKKRKSSKRRIDVERSQSHQRTFNKATGKITCGNASATVDVANCDDLPDIVREMDDAHRSQRVPVKYKLSLMVPRIVLSHKPGLRLWLQSHAIKLKGRPADKLGRECYVFSVFDATECPEPSLLTQTREPMKSTTATPREMRAGCAYAVNTGSKPSRTRRCDGMPSREEIDRAEAESCGITPLKRGLESDAAFARRSERHEVERYRRSQFE